MSHHSALEITDCYWCGEPATRWSAPVPLHLDPGVDQPEVIIAMVPACEQRHEQPKGGAS